MNRLIIDAAASEKRFALLENNKLIKLSIIQPGQESQVGNVFAGTVEKVLPGMNAVFVNLGGEKNGLLHRDKLAGYAASSEPLEVKRNKSVGSFVHQGEKLLVKIEKDAAGSKGPRLTGLFEFQGKNIIYMPTGNTVAVSKKIQPDLMRSSLRELGYSLKTANEGLIFRTESEESSEITIKEELEKLRSDYQVLLKKGAALKKPGIIEVKDPFFEEVSAELSKLTECEVLVNDLKFKQRLEKSFQTGENQAGITLHTSLENIFAAFQLEAEVDKALTRVIWLESGAFLIIDETEALTIIDVNTGKFSGSTNLEDTAVKTNREAANEIARQLKLRDVGGIILVDFIDMKENASRQKVLAQMEAALRLDERKTKVIGFTPLGILQITRAKTKPSLSEAMMESCQVCKGNGKVLTSGTVAGKLERELMEHSRADHEAVLVAATTGVAEVFTGVAERKKRLESALGFKLIFSVLDSPRPAYEIRLFGSEKELAVKAIT